MELVETEKSNYKQKWNGKGGKEAKLTWRPLQTFPPIHHSSSPTGQVGPAAQYMITISTIVTIITTIVINITISTTTKMSTCTSLA